MSAYAPDSPFGWTRPLVSKHPKTSAAMGGRANRSFLFPLRSNRNVLLARLIRPPGSGNEFRLSADTVFTRCRWRGIRPNKNRAQPELSAGCKSSDIWQKLSA